MIKCKNGECPKNKDICCVYCGEADGCEMSCSTFAPGVCGEAIIEEDTPKVLFENETALAISIIRDIEVRKNALANKEKEVRAAVKESMEKYGIEKFENDVIRITYKGEYERNTIDSKALKEDHPKIAKKYTKTSTVASSISIKLKG